MWAVTSLCRGRPGDRRFVTMESAEFHNEGYLQSAFKPEGDASDGRRNYGSYLELERIARGLVVVTNNTDQNWSIYFIQLISKYFMGSELVVVKVP